MAIYVNADHKTTPWKADVALMALPNTTRQVWRLETLSPAELLLLPALSLTCYGITSPFRSLPCFPPLLNWRKWHSALSVYWDVWMKITQQNQSISYRHIIYNQEALPGVSRDSGIIELLCLALVSEFQIWQTGLKFHVFSLPFPYHFLYRLSCLRCFTGKRSSFEGKI